MNAAVKHTPYSELDKYGADLTFKREGIALRTASGTTLFQHSPDPQAFEHPEPLRVSKPSLAVQHAFNAKALFDHALARIEKDRTRSEEGRRLLLAGEGCNPAVATLAAFHKDLGAFKADILNTEIHHSKVPDLDRADNVRLFHELEIRDHIRSLGDRAKPQLIRQILDGENPDVLLSILHSPLRFDSLHEDAIKGWRAFRDRQDPDTASRITLGKATEEWASVNLRIVANHIRREVTTGRKGIIQATPDEIFANMLPPGAHDLFGLRVPRKAA